MDNILHANEFTLKERAKAAERMKNLALTSYGEDDKITEKNAGQLLKDMARAKQIELENNLKLMKLQNPDQNFDAYKIKSVEALEKEQYSVLDKDKNGFICEKELKTEFIAMLGRHAKTQQMMSQHTI